MSRLDIETIATFLLAASFRGNEVPRHGTRKTVGLAYDVRKRTVRARGAREVVPAVDVASCAGILVNSRTEKTVRVRAGFTDARDSVGVEAFSGAGCKTCSSVVEEAGLAGCTGHCVVAYFAVSHAVLALPCVVVVEGRTGAEAVHRVGLSTAYYLEVRGRARNTVLVERP